MLFGRAGTKRGASLNSAASLCSADTWAGSPLLRGLRDGIPGGMCAHSSEGSPAWMWQSKAPWKDGSWERRVGTLGSSSLRHLPATLGARGCSLPGASEGAPKVPSSCSPVPACQREGKRLRNIISSCGGTLWLGAHFHTFAGWLVPHGAGPTQLSEPLDGRVCQQLKKKKRRKEKKEENTVFLLHWRERLRGPSRPACLALPRLGAAGPGGAVPHPWAVPRLRPQHHAGSARAAGRPGHRPLPPGLLLLLRGVGFCPPWRDEEKALDFGAGKVSGERCGPTASPASALLKRVEITWGWDCEGRIDFRTRPGSVPLPWRWEGSISGCWHRWRSRGAGDPLGSRGGPPVLPAWAPCAAASCTLD